MLELAWQQLLNRGTICCVHRTCSTLAAWPDSPSTHPPTLICTHSAGRQGTVWCGVCGAREKAVDFKEEQWGVELGMRDARTVAMVGAAGG